MGPTVPEAQRPGPGTPGTPVLGHLVRDGQMNGQVHRWTEDRRMDLHPTARGRNGLVDTAKATQEVRNQHRQQDLDFLAWKPDPRP